MSTLSDAQMSVVLLGRLRALRPDSARQWGKMNPHQAVCHLTDAFRMSYGERKPARVDNILTRTVIRWVALHTPLQWPHGIKTVPDADQVAGRGTPPAEWDRDVAELVRRIEGFPALREFGRHPIFGPLTPAEWGIWSYRHVDHHFRQFGV